MDIDDEKLAAFKKFRSSQKRAETLAKKKWKRTIGAKTTITNKEYREIKPLIKGFDIPYKDKLIDAELLLDVSLDKRQRLRKPIAHEQAKWA